MLSATQVDIPVSLRSLSDRAVVRLVGVRASERGRRYYARGAVLAMRTEGDSVIADVRGSRPEPYVVELRVRAEDGKLESKCSCPAWGPTDHHCKHVAAVLHACRKRDAAARAAAAAQAAEAVGEPSIEGPPPAPHPADGALVVAAPAAPSSSRRGTDHKRNRRARLAGIPTIRPRPGQQLGAPHVAEWLPKHNAARAFEVSFLLRPCFEGFDVSIIRRDGGRPLALDPATLQRLTPDDRRVARFLRAVDADKWHTDTKRVQTSDAADLLNLMRGKTVYLVEPDRRIHFEDEPLYPRIDLSRGPADGASEGTFRLTVCFERRSDGHRVPVAQSGLFEGRPGWIFEGLTAHPIAPDVPPDFLARFREVPEVSCSADELGSVLETVVPHIARETGARPPDPRGVLDTIDDQPGFRLLITGELLLVQARLEAVYGRVPVSLAPGSMGKDVSVVYESGKVTCIVRNQAREREAVAALTKQGLHWEQGYEAYVVNGETAMAFWTKGLRALPAEWERFAPPDLADVRVRKSFVAPSVQVGVGDSMDWLSLNVDLSADGQAVDMDDLRRCLSGGRGYVRLRDGSFAHVDLTVAGRVVRALDELAQGGGTPSRVPAYQSAVLDELINVAGEAAELDDGAMRLLERLRTFRNLEPVAVPQGLKAEMRPYQELGLRWLWHLKRHGLHGVLADDMGLGKTIQTLALLLKCKEEDGAKPSLIVVPTSVLPNWLREIEKFTPGLKALAWTGASRGKKADAVESADIVLTSYAILRRDVAKLGERQWRYLVLDEAQNIKNAAAATTKAAKELPADHRLALTGTPMENRLAELWSLFDFLVPGLFGPYANFRERYEKPAQQASDQDATRRLRARIFPFTLRRLKVDVLSELPPKTENDVFCDLTPKQRVLYRQVLETARGSVFKAIDKQGIAKSAISIFAALTRLRQVSCDPRLLELPESFVEEDSGKADLFYEMVDELVSGGHRALVFSQFVEMLTLLREGLDARKIPYSYLDGRTRNRMARVDEFNDDSRIPLFLISLKAGGSGLNLTGADYVIHYDPWWNPAVEDQATDRAHRIGQTRAVTAYKLIARGTVEEKILELKRRKKTLFENVVSVDEKAAKNLTSEDIEELFRID
jgi:superfamily II DNA or RNA helicase